MPFDIPTLPALIKRVRSDLTPSSDSGALRRSDGEALARVHGGSTFGLYAHQRWIADQILIDTCDDDMVLRLAALRLPSGRRGAVAAAGHVRCTGQSGRVIDAGATWRARDGRRYRAMSEQTIADGTAVVAVRAVDAGVAGQIDAGAELTAVSPILGVTDVAIVTEGDIRGGADEESIDELRERVRRTYRYIAHGGNDDDYVTWALEVPGVTRAWTRGKYLGPGTVGLFFMRDKDVDPFPGESECAVMQAHLEKQRPTNADVYAVAPKRLAVEYEIHVSPDTSEVRRSVEGALRELIFAEGGLGATLLRTHQSAAISQAAGEQDHILYAPAGDVVAAANELPVFGGIKWR